VERRHLYRYTIAPQVVQRINRGRERGVNEAPTKRVTQSTGKQQQQQHRKTAHTKHNGKSEKREAYLYIHLLTDMSRLPVVALKEDCEPSSVSLPSLHWDTGGDSTVSNPPVVSQSHYHPHRRPYTSNHTNNYEYQNNNYHQDRCSSSSTTSSSIITPTCPAMEDLSQTYVFRRIQPHDRDQIKALHEDWFPVR
jgi:hypothetical protein